MFAFVVDVVCGSDVLVNVPVMAFAELSVDVVVAVDVVLPVPLEIHVLEVLDEVLYEEEVCC